MYLTVPPQYKISSVALCRVAILQGEVSDQLIGQNEGHVTELRQVRQEVEKNRPRMKHK